jgi:raffinose/stachyose/melibiose transport system permease protein
MTRRRSPWLVAAPFIVPALVFYVLFLVVPLLGTIALGFTDWDGFSFSDIHFNGIDNYTRMVHDAVFVKALVNNVVFVLGAVALKVSVALMVALMLDRKLKLSGFFQGVYVIPAVLSLVVVGVVFQFALSPTLGFVNPLLEAVGLGQLGRDWLGDENLVLPILILVDTWTAFGLYMLLFVARLASISQDLRDAAAVDGADWWQDIRLVLVPLMRTTIVLVVLLAMIDSLKVFATVYAMTKGGPNHASEVLSTWGYFQGFTANDVGYGSSILVVLLAITLILSCIQVTRFSREP